MIEPTPQPLIQICTFGTLQVLRAGKPVDESDWRTRQARQLLKILVTERPQPVSTDRLIELLWPESTPDAAATTLRSAVNALRNVLEPDRRNRAPSTYIHTQSPGYAFRSHPQIWLDVEAFETLLQKSIRAANPAEKCRHLEAAIELYQDDYLISDPYADWARAERERLRERFFEGLLSLAAIYAHQGNHSAAISACRRVLARDEVRENAYQALMRYQAESGDSAAALLTYERCRLVLGDQLGADPSPITQQLHGRILNGEIETTPISILSAHGHENQDRHYNYNGTSAGEDSSLPQRSLLPPQDKTVVDLFVGRQQETAAIDHAYQQAATGNGSIVVLTGEMGVGKSRLAFQMLGGAEQRGATVISAACQRLEQSLPYAPLADALGRYLQLLPNSSLDRLPVTALAQLGQILPSLQDRLGGGPPWGEVQLSPEENRQRLIDGIVSFLTGLAAHRPLVLFLDDLHWADAETLAVVSRLSTRIQRHPLLLLLAYRQGDLVENEGLQTLLHALRRTPHSGFIAVDRLSLEDVRSLVQQLAPESANMGQTPAEQFAQTLYELTAGNALFITEAIRAWRERAQDRPRTAKRHAAGAKADGALDALSRRQRVQEIIEERIERLPAPALAVLQLAAVIGRDFSLELLESAATSDPAAAIDVLLRRQFLMERLDERLDFVHQIVRQVAYDGLNTLLRRRYHRQVAVALAQNHPTDRSPAEIAFHFGEAGLLYRVEYARYSVLAGEKLLRTFSLGGALAQFDNALQALTALPESEPDLISRALRGRGLAYENLLDPDGVSETYTRLRQWALRAGDKDLALMAHTRLTTLLGLVGQQAESNALMADLILDRTSSAVPSLADLMARHQMLFSEEEFPYDADDEWAPLQAPAPVPADPVGEITTAMEPAQAALPLLLYGWALQVQGQFVESAQVLEAAVVLSEETEQRALASLAYHQLAVTARMQGDPQRSGILNEQSKAINHQVHGTAAQLASLWPRISSAYEALARGEFAQAANRLQRVEAFLADRDSFRTHLNSTIIGLGLVALAQGDLQSAGTLLERGLADRHNRYPFTFVKGLLGQAHIAHQQGEQQQCEMILRRALRYAGQRSLVREYAESVEAIATLAPASAPIARLQRDVREHIARTGLSLTTAEHVIGTSLASSAETPPT